MIDLRDPAFSAAAVIAALSLSPHPEGGHYRETWRDLPIDGSRGAGTAIHFLLAAGEHSRWHRVDAAELWIWQAGAPLSLDVSDGTHSVAVVLGPDLAAGQSPQGMVPPMGWQAAVSTGAWTLVTCVVMPAFQFQGFQLAPPDWEPADRIL